ncbi:MAG TPA: alpha/beta fold hydrolase [Candidatus Sulfotelmatobacter sp.]|nr:alpha/beta fold hydrolase [Candidatus Sulfotelmatobacter sp.]
MLRSMLLPILLLTTSVLSAQTSSAKDVDIPAPDGIKLRATFFSAGKSGPGVLLLHMCNTTRKSWEPVAKALSERGVNVLTIDNRGFGESGGARFDGATPEVRQQLNEKWPADFDAAYQFLISQPGVDRGRIALGGGSCGVGNAVRLAQRHPDVKALVLLAGTTDVKGINFIADHPERPIFSAAAADDEYNDDAVQVMQWTASLSSNPRTKFSGFKDGKHGTEIFGPHPELVQQVVAFFIDTLVTKPVDLKATIAAKKTPASEFWTLADQKGGAARAAEFYQETRKRDPQVFVAPEFAINLLGYDRLQAGDKDEAIELFKLNTEAYPASANAQDSLSDGYLAAGQKELALAAEEKCVELLPGDKNNAQFKEQLGKVAQDKIGKLKSESK